MKALHIVTAFPRREGDVITPWLIETIHRLRARGVDVEVLAPSYRGLGDQWFEGIRVHRFRYAPARLETLTHDQTAPDRIRQRPLYAGLLPGYLVAGVRRAIELTRGRRFDLTHAFWPLPHGLLGLAARRSTGTPTISTFFGVELTWASGQLRPLQPLVRGVIRGSDRVTAISTHTARLITELVPTSRPAIIPFGAAIDPGPTAGDRPVRDAPDPMRLLFVGRLVERKGVHVLLDALAEPGMPDRISLDVVGDGPDREALQARADRLGLGSRARFHGFVDAGGLRERLITADCLVLPAIRDRKGDVEGLGVVLLEAMSFGIPVVASRSGGITDIVEDGRTGVLVEPGDIASLASAIRGVADDPARAAELGRRGRDTVQERFSWDRIIDSLRDLYAEVAALRDSYPPPPERDARVPDV